MSKLVAWAVLLLGVVHCVFGAIRFRVPLADAIADGFLGQFMVPEIRRTAFWFLMCGPLLMLLGHLAIRATARGDTELLAVIGGYMLAVGAVGVLAFPRSPLWALVVLGPLLIACGLKWLK